MTESMTLEEIFIFIHDTAENIKESTQIKEIEKHASVLSSIEKHEESTFTFTSGAIDAYMG